MKIYSYIVRYDFGFAPNPFNGCCTLATCKPVIRAHASIGDWVVGTGAKTKYNLAGYLIYAMKVDEIMDYSSYWNDIRFLVKRPVLNGSLKQLYGDNIYYNNGSKWTQADSRHSLEMGEANQPNIDKDTRVDRMLIARKFVYFGTSAPLIPVEFRPFEKTEKDFCCLRQGHRILNNDFAAAFISWLEKRNQWGIQGMPLEFNYHKIGQEPK